MANIAVKFPPEKLSDAQAYAAWADANCPFSPNSFSYVVEDVNGNHIVPYLGPPIVWNGSEIQEPAGGEEMRKAGQLVDSVDWKF